MCKGGEFPSLRHNEIRDITADLVSEVCHICTEPVLKPLSGESLPTSSVCTDSARLDIAADGFWGSRNERAFFDVKVFNPFASSISSESIATVYRKHEREKKREYDPHVREVEHGTFIPLVMSSTGGLSHEASTFYKRHASLIATKRNQSYSQLSHTSVAVFHSLYFVPLSGALEAIDLFVGDMLGYVCHQ